MDEYEWFFDSADDMPVALRIVYIGASVFCGLAALGALAILIMRGH